MPYIGERLRRIREERKLTQEELGALVGMKRTDISKAENDKLSIGPMRLERLAVALDVSVLELSPEAAPDEKGLDLLYRLEALEAAFVEERRRRELALRGATRRMAEIAKDLERLEQQSAPRQKEEGTQ